MFGIIAPFWELLLDFCSLFGAQREGSCPGTPRVDPVLAPRDDPDPGTPAGGKRSGEERSLIIWFAWSVCVERSLIICFRNNQ